MTVIFVIKINKCSFITKKNTQSQKKEPKKSGVHVQTNNEGGSACFFRRMFTHQISIPWSVPGVHRMDFGVDSEGPHMANYELRR